MIGFALVQAEFGEDAADVLLHGALGDKDPASDARVGCALGHQDQYLAFTRRQGVERIMPPVGPDEFADQGGIHDEAPALIRLTSR